MVFSCSGNILIIKGLLSYGRERYSFDDWLAEIGSPLLKAEFVLAEIDTVSFGRFCDYEQKYFPLMQNEEQRLRLCQYRGRPHSTLQKGERASNFIFPDTAGHYRSMADFRGKYKFIECLGDLVCSL